MPFKAYNILVTGPLFSRQGFQNFTKLLVNSRDANSCKAEPDFRDMRMLKTGWWQQGFNAISAEGNAKRSQAVIG